jgi:hypothetical protein
MLHVPTILFSTHANNIRCTNYDVPFTTFLLAPPVPFNTAQQGDSFYTFYTLSNGKTRNVLHKCVLKQLTFHSQMFNEPHSHLHTCSCSSLLTAPLECITALLSQQPLICSTQVRTNAYKRTPICRSHDRKCPNKYKEHVTTRRSPVSGLEKFSPVLYTPEF